MMQLQQAVNSVFVQLSGSLELISEDDYVRPCRHLSNSTIGQHVRHIIEMFQCLEHGYASGFVNYEKRKRDRSIETSKSLAMQLLNSIHDGLAKADKSLVLEGVYNDHAEHPMQFPTNYFREIVYNIEHTIHHMALIRVGIKELGGPELPENYGVASATVKHNRTCAQ